MGSMVFTNMSITYEAITLIDRLEDSEEWVLLFQSPQIGITNNWPGQIQ